MTIRIGKSFVEEETRRAVETEFGRGYRGNMPRKGRGEKREEVRKRMDRWKERVVRVQSNTVFGIISMTDCWGIGGDTDGKRRIE